MLLVHASFVFLLFHLIPSQIHQVNLHQTLQWIEIAQPNLDDYLVDSNIIFNHKKHGMYQWDLDNLGMVEPIALRT